MKIQLRKLKQNPGYAKYSIYGLIKSKDRRGYKTTIATKVGEIWITKEDVFNLHIYIESKYRRRHFGIEAVQQLMKLHTELDELYINWEDSTELLLFLSYCGWFKPYNDKTFILFNTAKLF